jgi:class 3 adenylate cyclase
VQGKALHTSKKPARELEESQRELERRIFHLKTLFDVSKEIVFLKTPIDIMKTLLMMIMGTFGSVCGVIVLINTQKRKIQELAQRSIPQSSIDALSYALETGYSDKISAITGSHILCISDSMQRTKNREVFDLLSLCNIHTWIPFNVNDNLIGGIGLGDKMTGDAYTSDDRELLSTLSSQGAVAIQNALLLENMKREELMRANLSRYLSPQIVEHIIKKDVEVNLGGKRKVITILFMDIIGFTSLSERLQPEEVVSFLNEYFKEMSESIFRWQGTLDKFAGDQIMAFWGAPVAQPDHAELAVRCALDVSKKLDVLRQGWKREGKPIVDCGIGLNTGEVLVGNIGVEGMKMDYTVIGDTVNLASRVEKLTRKYDTRILITENTLAHIQGSLDANKIAHIKLTDLAEVKVKGKEKGVRIYKLESTRNSLKFITD